MSVSTSDVVDQGQYAQYRAVCMSAVTTLVLGIISLPAILFSKLLVLPFLGIILGIYALLQLRRRSDELTGVGYLTYSASSW